MRKPDGAIDLIGTGLQLGLGIVDLVKEFAPSEEQRDDNRRKRKIKVAIRQLKHRFKNTPVDVYVNVNFAGYTEEARKEITTFIKSTLNQLP